MGYTTGISNNFFLTIMFCIYSVSKNSKIIQTFMFSEIVRPKMGLIVSSPLSLIGLAASEEIFEHCERRTDKDAGL